MALRESYPIKRKKRLGDTDRWVPMGTLHLFRDADTGKLTGGRVEWHSSDQQFNVFVDREPGEEPEER